MKQHWVAGIVLMLAGAAAYAQGPGAVRKMAESSLLVTGSIVIEPDGRTASVSIDKPDALPKEIVGFVTETAQQWKFKPVEQDGKAVRARAPMTVRVVAKKAENDTYSVEIRSANFGEDAPGTVVKSASMPPPRYPESAVRMGVTGTVYLAIRVDANGKVIDVMPEQTNLRVAASKSDMQNFRKVLERASVSAAKAWTFTPPTIGEWVGKDSWTVRVPVSYSLGLGAVPFGKYGEWETYIPGPRAPLPWVTPAEMIAGGADAISDGRLQQLGSGPQLLTPLGPG